MKRITKKEEMPKPPIPWEPVDADWKQRIQNFWWYQKHPVGHTDEEQKAIDKAIALRDRLLTFSGDIACMDLYDEHYDLVMERGQYWYGDNLRLWIGEPNQCHANVCRIWQMNQVNAARFRITTGYALSRDGCWRQHSWLVERLKTKDRIWETTKERIAYFGVMLSPEECKSFCDLVLG